MLRRISSAAWTRVGAERGEAVVRAAHTGVAALERREGTDGLRKVEERHTDTGRGRRRQGVRPQGAWAAAQRLVVAG